MYDVYHLRLMYFLAFLSDAQHIWLMVDDENLHVTWTVWCVLS